MSAPNEKISHPIEPVYDHRSKILILGSFPSVRSRAEGFFYGNPQNRFWKVIARIVGEEEPKSIEEKKEMLYRHGIALFDAATACQIQGSSDSTLVNAEPADLSEILTAGEIRAIFANGKKAQEIAKQGGYDTILLPSTSPANARWQLDALVGTWTEQIGLYLKL